MFLFKSTTNAQTRTITDSCKEYYRLAHLATVEVVRGNYENANRYYDDAFRTIPYPMFTDLNNALYSQCLSKVPDNSRIIELLTAIQNKGICVHERFKRFSKIQPFLHLVEESRCNSVQDSSLKKIIIDATESDQVLRIFSKEKLGRHYHPNLLPAIEKIDSVNYLIADSILQICRIKAISLENLVGLKGAESVDLIYRHNGAWGRYDLERQISYATSGAMDARLWAYVFDDYCVSRYTDFKPGERNEFSKTMSCDEMYGLFGSNVLRQYNNAAFVIELYDEVYKRITSMRQALYLPDVYEDAKIRAYAYYQNSEGFYYPFIVHLPYQNVDQIESFEKSIPYWSPHYIKYSSADDFDFERK